MFTPKYTITDKLLANITWISNLVRDLNDRRFPKVILVEFEKIMKPQVACCLTITNNLIFYTTGPFIFKIRENIFEFLMINHSLCCPVCDQGFDCDLQDEIKLFSSIQYRFKFKKQSYTNLFYTLFTTTYFNRCIRCTKCDRFELMISNKKILGTLLRGLLTEVNFFKKFIKKIFYYQSNIVDICPVSSFN